MNKDEAESSFANKAMVDNTVAEKKDAENNKYEDDVAEATKLTKSPTKSQGMHVTMGFLLNVCSL